MKLATLVYGQLLHSRNPFSKLFWSMSRKVIIKLLDDPSCLMLIHGRHLNMPLSHALPIYLANFRFYDSLPRRIAQYMRQKYGHIKCIDVGANIGDTIAAFYNASNASDKFLAIEPTEKFEKFLRANWKEMRNVKILSVACSSASTNKHYQVSQRNGTASIIWTDEGQFIETKSVDDIVHDNPEFADFNILKIDTDGHDFDVILGAKRILERNMPVVLFECYHCSNPNYVEDCFKSLRYFRDFDYDTFLVYDNFGNLMTKCALSDLSTFKNLLFYQLTSESYTFDLLFMRSEDIASFFKAEVSFFIDKMPDQTLHRTAAAIAD